MSVLDGVSQCWPMAEDCVIWWDAWAAIGAILSAWAGFFAAAVAFGSIIATAFLGLMTYRLGIAANGASDAALDLAKVQAEANQARDHSEYLILMMRLTGEFSQAWTSLEAIQDRVEVGNQPCKFLAEQDERDLVFKDWQALRFPNFQACGDRLHYLPVSIAGRMARVVGVVESFNKGIEGHAAPTKAQAVAALHKFRFLARILLADLEVIKTACESAVSELGLANQEIADEAQRIDEWENDLR